MVRTGRFKVDSPVRISPASPYIAHLVLNASGILYFHEINDPSISIGSAIIKSNSFFSTNFTIFWFSGKKNFEAQIAVLWCTFARAEIDLIITSDQRRCVCTENTETPRPSPGQRVTVLAHLTIQIDYEILVEQTMAFSYQIKIRQSVWKMYQHLELCHHHQVAWNRHHKKIYK